MLYIYDRHSLCVCATLRQPQSSRWVQYRSTWAAFTVLIRPYFFRLFVSSPMLETHYTRKISLSKYSSLRRPALHRGRISTVFHDHQIVLFQLAGARALLFIVDLMDISERYKYRSGKAGSQNSTIISRGLTKAHFLEVLNRLETQSPF